MATVAGTRNKSSALLTGAMALAIAARQVIIDPDPEIIELDPHLPLVRKAGLSIDSGLLSAT